MLGILVGLLSCAAGLGIKYWVEDRYDMHEVLSSLIMIVAIVLVAFGLLVVLGMIGSKLGVVL